MTYMFLRKYKSIIRAAAATALSALFLCVSGCNGENLFVDPVNEDAAGKTPTIAVTLVPAGNTATPVVQATEAPSATPTSTPTPTYTPTPTPTPVPEVSIVMTGDILVHASIEAVCRQPDGTYDYTAIFDNTRSIISSANLALVNQEIIIGGEELGVSGYPSFNAPYPLASALSEAGFDVVCHATNHALDKGKKGLLNCIRNWKENHPEISVVGICETEEESENILVVEHDGIKIAILNFTYGTNGISAPSDMPWCVSMLDRDAVARAIDRAEEIADFTVVCPHWGTEYTFTVSDQQRSFADLFYKHGADLVLGTHPHVIQEVSVFSGNNEYLWTDAGGALKPGQMLCYYSLGNFVSWTSDYGKGIVNRMLGALADVTLKRDENGDVYISDFSAIPVVSHVTSELNGVTVYPLADYTAELAASSEIVLQDSTYTLQYLDSTCNRIFGELWKKYGTPDLSEADAFELKTKLALSNGSSVSRLTDSSYKTKVDLSDGDTLTVSADSAEEIYGLYVKWYKTPGTWTLEYDGKTLECGTNGFLHEFVPLPYGVKECVMHFSSDESMCGINTFSAGRLPKDVQCWEPAWENADILVFSTHADDEILFLGGVLVNYGGELKKKVQVAYMCQFFSTSPIREHEKLDGLWTCGISHYPVNGTFPDTSGTTEEEARRKYPSDEVEGFLAETIRRFKPMVVVTQDLKGEYGHGGHMVLAESVANTVANTGNSDYHPESVEKYGVWDPPKTYLHLYEENKISLDVRQPLQNFGGATGLEILAEAYLKHVSQQWCWFYVADDYDADGKPYKYSVSRFGLYRSTVGADTGNDMLENIVCYGD